MYQGFEIEKGVLLKYTGEDQVVIIPDGVKRIGDGALEDCGGIISVTIPESVTKIGNRAFSGCSSLTVVTIPNSVKSIGAWLFYGCENLASAVLPCGITKIEARTFAGCNSLRAITIPTGVVSIGNRAFEGCSSLISVDIPESVSIIGDRAFYDCKSLRSIIIPEGIISIGDYAFEGCSSLADDSGMVIIGKKLYMFSGSASNVTIPEGTTVIGPGTFEDCSSITSVMIPESVNDIGSRAFSGCENLSSISIPKNVTIIRDSTFEGCENLSSVIIPEGVTDIGESAFEGCYGLKSISIPSGVKSIGRTAFKSCHSLKKVVIPNSLVSIGNDAFYETGAELVFEKDYLCRPVKFSSYSVKAISGPKSCAYAVIYQSGKIWDKSIAEYLQNNKEDFDTVLSEIIKIIHDDLKAAVSKKAVEFVLLYPDMSGISVLKSFYETLVEIKAKSLQLFLDNKISDKILNLKAGSDKKKAIEKDRHPIEKLVDEHWKSSDIKAKELTQKLRRIIKAGIKYRDSDRISSPEAVIFVIREYAVQHYLPNSISRYKNDYVTCSISEVADKVAAALEPEPLQVLLEQLAYEEKYRKDGYLLALGRYGNGQQISQMISRMRDWESWSKYKATGRSNIIIARGALMLSDTREAMLALDRSGHFEAYAKLRSMDADELRDTYLSDFGFDREGNKYYDLGRNTLRVSIAQNLALLLFDCGANKIVKSIPKRNVDPVLYENARKDLAELKKNVRHVVKNRSRTLFDDFLSGRKRNVCSWKKSYLENPLLKGVAELIVWKQGNRYYTITGAGLTDSYGKSFSLDENDIQVAYPSEMESGELLRWQQLFLNEKRSQPFEQIWEPVIDPASIREDRYKGREVGIYTFSNQEKHGITTYGMTDYSSNFGFRLTDCELEAEPSVHRIIHGYMGDDAVYKLGRFRLKEYTRISNHITGLLDRWTISSRILKDEIDIQVFLTSFTLPQIMELIELALKNDCRNSLAVLMDYKNKHYKETDPMIKFVLD